MLFFVVKKLGEKMNYKQFKIMDLFILSVLAFGSEFLGYYLIEQIETPFYLSFSLAICFVAMMRWGFTGVITYIISGVALFMLKDDTRSVGLFAYEVIANAAFCIPFLFFINKDKNVIVKKTLKFFAVLGMCIFCLTITKGIVIMIVDKSFTGAIEYFGFNLLFNLMNVGLLFLLVKIKSQLLTDMKIYLTAERQTEEELENE